MADFNIAYDFLISDEGGYSNNPSDPGGETYKGITRRDFPSWVGWATIDAQKRLSGFPKSLSGLTALEDDVKSFYRNIFWKFDGLTSQYLANKLLSESVNIGPKVAVKILQASLQALQTAANVSVDGQFGPHTIAAANLAPADALGAEFRAQLVFHYRDIEKANPKEEIFDKGWIRRAVK